MRRCATAMLAAGVLGATALVSAGCDTKSNGAPTSASTTTTAAPATTTTHSASAATLKPRAGLLTAGSCERLYEIAQSYSAALNGENGELTKTAAMLTEFATETPSDIRPDFRVLASAYTRILDALKGIDAGASSSPSRALLDRLTKLSNQIDMTRVGTANTNVT